MIEVEWDLGEWRWPPLDASESPVPFFSYSTRTGRHALGALQCRLPTQAHSWHAHGISLVFPVYVLEDPLDNLAAEGGFTLSLDGGP